MSASGEAAGLEALPVAFTIIACYGIGFGVLSLPAALFVGPHLLAASCTMISMGAASAAVARGLRNRRRWAWGCGLLLSSSLALLCGWGAYDSWRAQAFSSAVYWGAMFALSVMLLGGVSASSSKYRRGAG